MSIHSVRGGIRDDHAAGGMPMDVASAEESRPAANETSKRCKVLVVDDDGNSREALACRLTQQGYSVEMAEDGAHALEKAFSKDYDLVLLDQMMPGMTGIDVLRRLRGTFSQGELPVIMLTGIDEPHTVVEALALGANDYVVKPVDVLVVAARIQSQLDRSRTDRAARASDPLTGLSNRTSLLNRMTETLVGPRHTQAPSVAVLFLDLDGFKAVNDSFGHIAGDKILVEVASRIQATLRNSGVRSEETTIARIGGDEFVVLLENVLQDDQPTHLAEAILSRLAAPTLVHHLELVVTASIGIAVGIHGATTPEELLQDADLAMYRAKELGKNRWHTFETGLRVRAQARMSIAVDLRHAVERGELGAVYQPEMNLLTGAIVGFECLMRWRHPERGWLLPDEFIPVAEETGLIVRMGGWILDHACRQLKDWQTKFPGPRPLTMNVNLSVKQLSDPGLVGRIRTALTETGVLPETIAMELTESVLMTDIDSAKAVLDHLRSLNVGLKLDDFGTGYSSLSYLRALHFSSLKIDRSFVSRLATDRETSSIVGMIIELAHDLRMTVVAEGIEDEYQLAELVRLGCDTGQGYHLARPMTSADAEILLEARRVSGGTTEWDRPLPVQYSLAKPPVTLPSQNAVTPDGY